LAFIFITGESISESFSVLFTAFWNEKVYIN
jgi:hypothetical protein